MLRLVLLSTIVALAYGRIPRIPPLDGRIVGGESTTIEEYPYQVSLGYSGSHSCGGSLIAPNVVLTAAHCVSGSSPSGLTIRAGSTKRAQGGKLVQVAEICRHPQYNPYDYDVALLRLSESFELSASIQTISPASEGDEVADGTLATITGWGRLSSGGISPSNLQKVQVPKVSQKSCIAAYPFEDITSRMTCYGVTEGGKDSCQGDSGGPLVVDGKVAGIVSWGYGCAQPRIPGVYANVADKGIRSHIDNCLEKFGKSL